MLRSYLHELLPYLGIHTGDSITVAPALTLTDKDLVELAPGQEWSVKVVWIGKQTSTGCKVTNMADAGAYWAHGRNSSLNSDGVKFVVQ